MTTVSKKSAIFEGAAENQPGSRRHADCARFAKMVFMVSAPLVITIHELALSVGRVGQMRPVMSP